MTTRTYSPKEVEIKIGSLILDQWTKLSVEKNEDDVSVSAATTGEVTRTMNCNTLGKITFELPQTCKHNGTLTLLLNNMKDKYKNVANPESTDNGFLPIHIEDKLGGSLHIMAQASFAKSPKADYDKAITNRTWVFVGELDKNDNMGNF